MLRSLQKFLVSSVALVVAGFFLTAPASAAGDPVRGKTLGYTSPGCHGIETYKNVYPTYSVPKLRGQHPWPAAPHRPEIVTIHQRTGQQLERPRQRDHGKIARDLPCTDAQAGQPGRDRDVHQAVGDALGEIHR